MKLIHKYLNWARRSAAYGETQVLKRKILSEDPLLKDREWRRIYRANKTFASIIQWIPAFVVATAMVTISLIIIRFA